jgi:hypothetical protein
MKVHAKYKVGLRAFKKLKPYYAKRLKERNTCACKYHMEMMELQHGFNDMQTTSKLVHGRKVRSQLKEPKDVLIVGFLCTMPTLKMYHI